MKWTIIFITLLGLIACNNQTGNKQTVSGNNDTTNAVNAEKEIASLDSNNTDDSQTVSADDDSTNTFEPVQYSDEELIALLDSIGHLNPNSWTEELASIVDTVLNSPIQLNKQLSPKDFKELKATLKDSGKNTAIDLDLAKRIFPQLEIDSSLAADAASMENKLPINFHTFDKNTNDFNEFAISIGPDERVTSDNDVYFFKSDKIIAKHEISHFYGFHLKHFKNEINETVIYYRVNYERGTGILWDQFNFYRYDTDKLLPTLTEIRHIWLDYFWSSRPYRIKSNILSTKPLKLKFVFNNQFTDSSENQIDFINDSTVIKYKFNTIKKIYEPEFTDTKLNKLKLLTYFHADNNLLFVNANYDLLKKELSGNDQARRQAIMNYLLRLKNRLNRRKHGK